MKKINQFILLIPLLLLASCNLPSSQTTPTQASNAVYTAAAQTVSAHLTEAAVQTASQAALIPTNTLMPSPTNTLENTPIPPATNTSAPLLPTATQQVCNRAQFVSDVTIPDGTEFQAGDSFTKTWRFKNVGTCTWTTDYEAVFKYEDKMGATSPVSLSKSVAPGETIDLSIDMVAPSEAGEYTGFWKLRDDDGDEFDSGMAQDKTFYVQIKVISGVFAVTGVNASVDPSDYSGQCNPVSLTFSADIRVNKAGTISYHWEFSDADNSPKTTLKFSEAGTKTVEYVLDLTKAAGDFSGWGRIYIDDPNHQLFPKASYTLTCSE